MNRDSLYSNSPRSSRTGEAWVYQDGELYHYGRKGMKWGKTIFGGIDNPRSLIYDPNYGKGRWRFNQNPTIKNAQRRPSVSRPSSGVSKVVKDAKNFGGWVFNKARKLGENSARSGWTSNQIDFNNYKSTSDMNKRVSESPYIWSTRGMSHLEQNMTKQIREGQEAYNAMRNDGSIKNILNLAIQNAQYDVVSGLNNVLTKLGLDDEVDRVLSKFLGDSEWQARDKATQQAINYNETKGPDDPTINTHDAPYEYGNSDPGRSPYEPNKPTQRKRPSSSAAERVADRIPTESDDSLWDKIVDTFEDIGKPIRNPNVRKPSESNKSPQRKRPSASASDRIIDKISDKNPQESNENLWDKIIDAIDDTGKSVRNSNVRKH